MKLKISILTAILTLVATACLENEIVYDSKNLEYRQIEFTGPIAKVHVPLFATMKKRLKFKELIIDNDGLICVRYFQSEGIEWSEIGLRGYSTNWTIPISGGSVAEGTEFKVRLLSSEEADSYVSEASLETGEISFTLFVTGGLSGDIVVTIPELTKDGVAFTETISLSSSGTPNEYSLEGYIIATDTNRDEKIQFAGNDISGSGSLNVAFKLSEMDVSYLSGYFGKMIRNEEVEMDIDFFDELDFEGIIGIKDIKIDAVVTNRVGMPMNVSADAYFINRKGMDEQLELTPQFDFEVDGASTPAMPVVKLFSTMLPVFEFGGESSYPTKLKFEFEGVGNPDGNPNGDVENFIIKSDVDSLAKIYLTLTVPLHIKVEEYSREDIINFDYNDFMGNDEKYINNVEYLYINLTVDNGLPFDITLEATAIDESGTYRSPILSGTNIISEEMAKRIEIKLDKDQLEEFRTKEVKQINLQTKGKTKNEDYVKVNYSAFLDITVSIKDAKLNIPSNL